jgi:hypothetical protein
MKVTRTRQSPSHPVAAKSRKKAAVRKQKPRVRVTDGLEAPKQSAGPKGVELAVRRLASALQTLPSQPLVAVTASDVLAGFRGKP